MILTKQQALSLHQQMWSDMQRDLGDCPTHENRAMYKEKWITDHYPNEEIECRCFLCEYIKQLYNDDLTIQCRNCPVDWGAISRYFCCEQGVSAVDWRYSPISEILALPERN